MGHKCNKKWNTFALLAPDLRYARGNANDCCTAPFNLAATQHIATAYQHLTTCGSKRVQTISIHIDWRIKPEDSDLRWPPKKSQYALHNNSAVRSNSCLSHSNHTTVHSNHRQLFVYSLLVVFDARWTAASLWLLAEGHSSVTKQVLICCALISITAVIKDLFCVFVFAPRQTSARSLTSPWRETAVRSAASWVTQTPVGCPVSPRLSARPATPPNCLRLCLIRRGGAWDAWPMGVWGLGERRTGHASHLPAVPTPVVTTRPVTTPHWKRCLWAWRQSSRPPVRPPITPRKGRYTCEITTPTIFDAHRKLERHVWERDLWNLRQDEISIR